MHMPKNIKNVFQYLYRSSVSSSTLQEWVICHLQFLNWQKYWQRIDRRVLNCLKSSKKGREYRRASPLTLFLILFMSSRIWRGRLRRSQRLTIPVQPEVNQHRERRDIAEIQEPSGGRGSGSRRGTERRFPHSRTSERKTAFESQFRWESEIIAHEGWE